MNRPNENEKTYAKWEYQAIAVSFGNGGSDSPDALVREANRQGDEGWILTSTFQARFSHADVVRGGNPVPERVMVMMFRRIIPDQFHSEIEHEGDSDSDLVPVGPPDPFNHGYDYE